MALWLYGCLYSTVAGLPSSPRVCWCISAIWLQISMQLLTTCISMDFKLNHNTTPCNKNEAWSPPFLASIFFHFFQHTKSFLLIHYINSTLHESNNLHFLKWKKEVTSQRPLKNLSSLNYHPDEWKIEKLQNVFQHQPLKHSPCKYSASLLSHLMLNHTKKWKLNNELTIQIITICCFPSITTIWRNTSTLESQV